MSRGEERSVGYDAAMRELDEILTDMEDERIGIDELAPKVERAAKLIRHCRSVLKKTGAQVEDAVRGLMEDVDADREAGGDG